MSTRHPHGDGTGTWMSLEFGVAWAGDTDLEVTSFVERVCSLIFAGPGRKCPLVLPLDNIW